MNDYVYKTICIIPTSYIFIYMSSSQSYYMYSNCSAM